MMRRPTELHGFRRCCIPNCFSNFKVVLKMCSFSTDRFHFQSKKAQENFGESWQGSRISHAVKKARLISTVARGSLLSSTSNKSNMQVFRQM